MRLEIKNPPPATSKPAAQKNSPASHAGDRAGFIALEQAGHDGYLLQDERLNTKAHPVSSGFSLLGNVHYHYFDSGEFQHLTFRFFADF
jgi:hypothetical protein